jgi:hypothetical protein
MIIKLQRPLATSGGEPPLWLAYPRGRQPKWFIAEADLPGHVLPAVGRDLKGYFEATPRGETLAIGRRVADQPW